MVPWFPLLGLAPSGLFMGSSSTLIYTAELILCFTINKHQSSTHTKCSNFTTLSNLRGLTKSYIHDLQWNKILEGLYVILITSQPRQDLSTTNPALFVVKLAIILSVWLMPFVSTARQACQVTSPASLGILFLRRFYDEVRLSTPTLYATENVFPFHNLNDSCSKNVAWRRKVSHVRKTWIN